MKKNIEKGVNAMTFGRHAVGIFLFALALLLGAQAWGAVQLNGYQQLNNDRILLMNNDTWSKSGRSGFSITNQGYSDPTWEHIGTAHRSYKAYLAGTNHVLFALDGTRLWHLSNCRAGSAATMGGNFLPTSPTAQMSDTAPESCCVIMQNSLESQVVSPYYNENGVGTIYFDAVNLFGAGTATCDPIVQVQMATNLIKGVAGNLETETIAENFDWHPCHFDVLTVQDGKVSILELGVTNLVLCAPASGGSSFFYRVRAKVNWRGPARIRIIRTTIDETAGKGVDAAGTILVDNIQVSMPPMTVEIERVGNGFDDSLKGKEVLGFLGDLSVPFVAVSQTNALPCVKFHLLTNSPPAKNLMPASLDVMKFHYRWRYLNQFISKWQEIDFLPKATTIECDLKSERSIALTNGVGDLEYFFTANATGGFYVPQDFAYSSKTPVGWGDWTEEIPAITNRATYTVEDGLPSGGTDYFVRIREGESSYEWIKFVAELTTFDERGGTNIVTKILNDKAEPRLELVSDHTWRYHYYVKEADIGKKLSFHFVGKEVYTNEVPFTFASRTNTWYSSDSLLNEIPFTATLNGSADATLTLDGTGTHLLFEVNDEKRSFSVSHATYQDVNRWTDARKGYVGHSVATNSDVIVTDSGVSDKKEKFEQIFEDWKLVCPFISSFWLESFDIDKKSTAYPIDTFFSQKDTPNGWRAYYMRFVAGARGVDENLAVMLDGLGKGALTMDNFTAATVPPGIDTVSFTARTSQQHDFFKFLYNQDATGLKNYGFSARLSMSRLYDSKLNTKPSDISPVYPSVSLIGYRRDQGCYEYRITRTHDTQLTCALYRWKNIDDENAVATLLASNVISSASSGAKPGPGQSAYTYNNFANLLVPQSNDDVMYCKFSGAYISLYTASDKVHIECALSSQRADKEIKDDGSNLKKVLVYDDTSAERLKKGSYGVDAVDCPGVFASLCRHDFIDETDFSRGLNMTGTRESDLDSEWGVVDGESSWPVVSGGRWAFTIPYRGSGGLGEAYESVKGPGVKALVPSNQTIKVYLTDANLSGTDAPSIYSGYEVPVASFSTNRISVSPQIPGLWKIRLQTGDSPSAVVLDDVSVTPWQGITVGEVYGTQLHDDYSDRAWAYTKAWVESAADIVDSEGNAYANFETQSVGTNGFVFIFRKADGLISFTPRMDMTVTRILVVGSGGGSGTLNDNKNYSKEWKKDKTVTLQVGAKAASGNGGQSTIKPYGESAITSNGGQSTTAGTSDITGEPVQYGLKGEDGTVIICCQNASKVVRLQPARGARDTSQAAVDGQYPIPPMGIRSPYIDNGLSMFSFSYVNADTNCVLLVQIATNMPPDLGTSPVRGLTFSTATNDTQFAWTTIARYDFEKDPRLATEKDRQSGTLTTFLSLRKHIIDGEYQTVCGVMRVIVDPEVVKKAVESTEAKMADPTSNRLRTEYGQITITKVYCYNEPPIDSRSWFGWNVYTEGWDSMKAGDYAYLTDWPDGLSLSLNYSALKDDNTAAAAKGIGFGEPDKASEYAAQNPFVQCPEMTNGIGSVSFRARLFDTNAEAAVVSLYLGTNAGDDQTDDMAWLSWDEPVTNFVVTSPTYQTFEWKTTRVDNPWRTIRLEVAGARHGRNPSTSGQLKGWEKVPDDIRVEPLQRVFIDEISVGEPIAPRLALRHCRPFRSNLRNEEICVITNITSADQQPILGESWGIQVQVEPQQMSDDLNMDTVKVHMSVLRGESPWGYDYWPEGPTKALVANDVLLPRVDPSNLVFRSHYSVPGSIMPPEETPSTYYQYKVWVEYFDKSQNPSTDEPHVQVLNARDWSVPEWYNGVLNHNEEYDGIEGRFAAFTIIDSISPWRAWLNEVQVYEGNYDEYAGDSQFIEFAVPQNSDLTNWVIQVHTIDGYSADLATLGSGNALKTLKIGTREGVDYLKEAHYTFYSLRCPKAAAAGKIPEADGTWSEMTEKIKDKWGSLRPKNELLDMRGGSFNANNAYGIRLIRPSGIIEHEITVQGYNVWGDFPGGEAFSGTNLVHELLSRGGPNSSWIFAGEDTPTGTVGVVKSHGEYGEYGRVNGVLKSTLALNCWTNFMAATPGALNVGQVIPNDYFLPAFGTNVWIYANALGDHVWTVRNGVTNKADVLIVEQGSQTGLTFWVENWYQSANCVRDDMECPAGNGHAGLWTLDLGKVDESTEIDVGDEQLTGLKDLGIDKDNDYYDAVMYWLTRNWPDKDADDITRANFVDLSGKTNGVLTLTEMYWLGIPPIDNDPAGRNKGENWVFKAGMGSDGTGDGKPNTPDNDVVVRVEQDDEDGSVHKDVDVTVTMMISNVVTGFAYAPTNLQGLVAGETSANFDSSRGRWQGPTFKIRGALQANGVGDRYLPLRTFMLCEKSFGGSYEASPFTTTIHIMDPQTRRNSPGWSYGWHVFQDANVWYRFGLGVEEPGYTSIEMLDESTRVNRNPNP